MANTVRLSTRIKSTMVSGGLMFSDHRAYEGYWFEIKDVPGLLCARVPGGR